MTKNPNLTRKEQMKIIQMFHEGYVPRKIGVAIGRSEGSVRKVILQNGLKIERDKVTPEEKDKIVHLYHNGSTSIAQIAKIVGRGETTVARVFKQYGLETVNPKLVRDDEEELFFKLYSQGYDSLSEISRMTGRGITTIARFFERNNLVTRFKQADFTDAQVDSVVSAYLDNVTSVEIATKYNVSPDTILRVLRNSGVDIRSPQNRRSKITNHDFFSKIDSPEKAYFLGFIISDGSVQDVYTSENASRRLSIQLQGRDAYILRDLERYLGGKSDTVSFTNRGEATFRVSSRQLTDDLERYGVVPRKTGREYLPKIDEKFMPHLVRGIFDGDGCVSINKYSIKVDFCGSSQLCQGIKEYLARAIGVSNNKIYERTNQDIHVFTFAKLDQVLRFYKLIYKNATVCLERKKVKFEHFFTARDVRY